MLEVLLSRDQHEIRVAHDGRTALEIAATFDPEVALLDIGLPDMDGCDLGKILRAKIPGIVLVAISGWGKEKGQLRSREAGFDHHLLKPVAFDALQRLFS